MTHEEIVLVRASFDRVWPVCDRVAARFYERLFELAPETRGMFDEDLSEQKRKLVAMLAMAVGLLDQPSLLKAAVQDLGRRHRGYRVHPEHYAPVGQALVESLAEGLGPGFTAQTRSAWTALYGQVSGLMLKAAQAA